MYLLYDNENKSYVKDIKIGVYDNLERNRSDKKSFYDNQENIDLFTKLRSKAIRGYHAKLMAMLARIMNIKNYVVVNEKTNKIVIAKISEGGYENDKWKNR